MSKEQIVELAAEVNRLRVESSKADDINQLFEFADKAKLFEEAWINAAGKRGAKPKTILNPYTGKTVRKTSFKPIRDSPLYRKTFIELSRNFNRGDVTERVIRDFGDKSKDVLRDLINSSDEKAPDLVDRYIEIQKRGVGSIERQLPVPEAVEPIAVDEPIAIDAAEGSGGISLPSDAGGVVERLQDLAIKGIDIGRIPFDRLGDNLARRVMRRDLLPAPVLQRRRGRGAMNWRDWVVDTVRNVGTGVGAISSLAGVGSYLYHTVMNNTPLKNKAETAKILEDAGIIPEGTIEDALAIKAAVEKVETAKGGGTEPISRKGKPFQTQGSEGRSPPSDAADPVDDPPLTGETPEPVETAKGGGTVSAADPVDDPRPPPTGGANVKPIFKPPSVPRPPLTGKTDGGATVSADQLRLREDHMNRIRLEQQLLDQRIKQQEETRRIATLYTQNPDDYMAAGPPNSYDRPMYSDEWVDIKRLQRLQTAEYTQREKEIWARNYQTPWQLGAGTIDNSVKDIKNVVERLAQLERRLRYDYATPGLPRDERHPAVSFGRSMERAGVIPDGNRDVERWGAYLDVVDTYNMDKYQHLQRQNEPPHGKLINRDAQFGRVKLTPDIPSQQKIYDEPRVATLYPQNPDSSTTEGGMDTLDIQNDMDYAYFYRRIRKH